MITKINPYLTFDGTCREAMTFYRERPGRELTLQTVADSPMADQWPLLVQQYIVHASLPKDRLVLSVADITQENLINGSTITLELRCSSQEEIENFFSGLSCRGNVFLHTFSRGTNRCALRQVWNELVVKL